MKGQNIYESALSLIGETPGSDSASDYFDRAPYILAIFCDKVAHIDKCFRETHGLESQKSFNEVFMDLESEFPLCSRFVDSAAHYLAAMFVVYENEKLHDRLFSIHCDMLSSAISEIPYSKEKIKNAY